MNWLDVQTKELLQKVQDEKLAPPKTAEFALVLLRKGSDFNRLVHAIAQINKCGESDATSLARRKTPLVINPDLTEEQALWGQFELICCDAIGIFLRSEVLEQNGRDYLEALFRQVMASDEFKLCSVRVIDVPNTESGEKFIAKFLNRSQTIPIAFETPFKKARIMEHWAKRVGAQLELDRA